MFKKVLFLLTAALIFAGCANLIPEETADEEDVEIGWTEDELPLMPMKTRVPAGWILVHIAPEYLFWTSDKGVEGNLALDKEPRMFTENPEGELVIESEKLNAWCNPQGDKDLRCIFQSPEWEGEYHLYLEDKTFSEKQRKEAEEIIRSFRLD